MQTMTRYPAERYVATRISQDLLTWFHAVHRRKRIGVIAGPPGIGKTQSIAEFQSRYGDEVVVVKIGMKNAGSTTTLRFVAAAIQGSSADGTGWMPNGLFELQRKIFAQICERQGINIVHARAGLYPPEAFTPLTLIIDEAQNLSREAIELLRFWCDPEGCYSPVPLGLVFVGNSEFNLAATSSGESVLSAAVADRAIVNKTLTYNNVSLDDLRLYAEDRGVSDPGALAAISTHFLGNQKRTGKPEVRSLRQLRDLIDNAIDLVGEGDISEQVIARLLAE